MFAATVFNAFKAGRCGRHARAAVVEPLAQEFCGVFGALVHASFDYSPQQRLQAHFRVIAKPCLQFDTVGLVDALHDKPGKMILAECASIGCEEL